MGITARTSHKAANGPPKAPPYKRTARLARDLAREAARLLRRRGARATEAGREAVERRLSEVEERLATAGKAPADARALHAAAERLDDALEDHLGRYRKSVLREYAESIGWALVLAVIIRALIFEAFSIPSSSMMPTLDIGDRLFVNKIAYGVYAPFQAHRWWHFSEPTRGDVIVFEFHERGNPQDGENYIKRVIGVPGDTVELRDNVIILNGQPIPTRAGGDDPNFHGVCGIFREDYATEPVAECACEQQRETLGPGDDRSKWDTTYTTQHFVRVHGRGFPFDGCDARPSWSLRGADPIERDKFRPEACRVETLAALGSLGPAVREACAKLDPTEGPLRVPRGHLFVMGDNRDQSEDGRYWGLVPFDRVKGTAFVIWWARDMSRFFNWVG